MKRFTNGICVLLVCVMVLSTAAIAAEPVEPRGSDFFLYSSVYFWRKTGQTYEIWFDVLGTDIMLELGARKIVVQRSTDGENWVTARTILKEDYPQMTEANSLRYANCVTFAATNGYCYRAIVYLYARNSTGIGSMMETTAVLDLR